VRRKGNKKTNRKREKAIKKLKHKKGSKWGIKRKKNN
jgi:hypothetical protein